MSDNYDGDNSDSDFDLSDLNNINFKESNSNSNSNSNSDSNKITNSILNSLDKPKRKYSKRRPKNVNFGIASEDLKPQTVQKMGFPFDIVNDTINEIEMKEKPKLNSKPIQNDENEKPTELLGKERIELLQKVNQYKILFPKELASFKIKKNPDLEYLKKVIDEMDAIISTSTVETFVLDGLYSSLQVIEGTTANTNFDVSGLSDLLKSNKQFSTLCKSLFLKYGMYSSVPAEYQLMFIVFTSAWICRQKNKNKKSISKLLDEPISSKPTSQIINDEPILKKDDLFSNCN